MHLSDYEYDQTFDTNILIGHFDLILRFSDFALYRHSIVYEHLSHCLPMTRTLASKVVLCHCDLILRFSDFFSLYLGTQLVYEHISFTVCLCMTRPLTLK